MDSSTIFGIFVVIVLFISVILLIKEIIVKIKERKKDKEYLKETGAKKYIYANHYKGLEYPEDMECTIYAYEDYLKIVPVIGLDNKDIFVKEMGSVNYYKKRDIENKYLEKNDIEFLGLEELHKNLREHKKNRYKGIDGVISIKLNEEEVSFFYRGDENNLDIFLKDII